MRLQLLLAFVLFGCACATVVRMKLEKSNRDLSSFLRNRRLRPHRLSNKGVAHDVVNYDYTQLFTNITVGTPPQQLRVLVDTQDGHLYVFEKSCNNCKPLQQHLFDSSASTTFSDTGKSFVASRGFPTYGVIGKDVFTLGGVGEQQIKVTDQLIGLAQLDNGGGSFDGLLGLAFPSMAADGLYPPLFTAINQGKFDKPIFTLYVAETGLMNSMLTYGGLDTENCEDVIGYVPLSEARHWTFRIKSISVGHYAIASQSGWDVILNSLEMDLALPEMVAEGLFAELGATLDEECGLYAVSCDAVLPNINLPIGSLTIDIKPDRYAWAECDEQKRYLNLITYPSQDFFLLGAPFLEGRCVIHDIGMQRIGFAEPKNHAAR